MAEKQKQLLFIFPLALLGLFVVGWILLLSGLSAATNTLNDNFNDDVTELHTSFSWFLTVVVLFLLPFVAVYSSVQQIRKRLPTIRRFLELICAIFVAWLGHEANAVFIRVKVRLCVSLVLLWRLSRLCLTAYVS
jgi:hypothetical protein